MIRKALSGFYYVHTEDGCVLECRAKGVFRKEGITPLVGDQVEVENGVVSRILPRKNQILRPPGGQYRPGGAGGLLRKAPAQHADFR